MTTAAVRIHALVASLGIQKAAVVGDDIGLMVAYAYAARFPDEVEKLALMDAFLPGVDGWEAIYNNPGIWHFRFKGTHLLRAFLERFRRQNAFDYTTAYSRVGAMRAGWVYFVSFQKAAQDFAALARSRLSMPLLAMGGEKGHGETLGRQAQMVGLRNDGTLADGRAARGDYAGTSTIPVRSLFFRSYRWLSRIR